MLTGPSFVPDKMTHAIIMCHGYGSNGDDLMGLVPYLKHFLPQTGFFCPNAPTPMMYNGFEWFSLSDYTMAPEFVSTDYLDTLVKRCEKPAKLLADYINMIKNTYHVADENIILMGFSQGGLLALYTGLTVPYTIGGLIGCSAVPIVFEKVLPSQNISKNIPVLLTHGDSDSVVPPYGMDLNVHQLAKIGIIPTTFLSSNLGHGIDEACLQHIIPFIQNCLKD